MDKEKQIGLLLLNMGGPDCIDSVKPFLQNLFKDRDIIRLGPAFLQRPIATIIINRRLKKTIHAYNLIGGKSPLPEITSQQAKELQRLLDEQYRGKFIVSVGMRYWHPFIEDALTEFKNKAIDEVIGLSLYPQYSKATTGSTIKVFEKACKKLSLSYKSITSWFDNPLYIDSLVEIINEGFKKFNHTPYVLFSAHNLPKKFIDAGDPYVKHTEVTVKMVVDKLKIQNWSLAYQSKTGPVKWLEPTTDDKIKQLAKQDIKDILLVPISFVSDHIETLYEIDMLYKEMANSMGINLTRTESLNTRKTFIHALKRLVLIKCQKEF